MPRQAGQSAFDKILNEYGGYVVDENWIKLINSVDASGFIFHIPVKDIRMQFALQNEKLISRLHIQMYEPCTNNGIVTRSLKFIGFNGKVYKVVKKQAVRKLNIDGVVNNHYYIILDIASPNKK